MKRNFLLVFIFISSSQIVTAQITKGDIFLGGAIGFGTSKANNVSPTLSYRNTTLTISPALGWVTKDNLVWGFDIPAYLLTDDQDSPNHSDRRRLQVGAGVFVRKYFEIAKQFYLFTQGRFGGQYILDESTYDFSITKAEGFQLDLSFAPGLSYAIKKNIHLESGLSNLAYISYYQLHGTSSRSSGIALGALASGQTEFSVGLRFFLQRKA